MEITRERRFQLRAMELLQSTRLSGICLILALLCLWEASARLHWIDSPNWPPFSVIVVALFRGIASGEIIGAIGSTLWRMARGYAIGCAIALPVGFALALSRPIRLTLEPTFELLRPIPIPAIIPPLIFILGTNDPLKLFVIAFAIFFPIVLNTISGIIAVDTIYLQVARTFGHSRPSTLWQVVLPASMPFVLAGLRTSLALALIVAVVTEMIAGNSGVGYYLNTMQFAMRAADMYAAIIFLTVIAYAINRAFEEWEGHLLRWARLRENAG